MKTTKIEWTDKTWNPITGCTKISPGCAHWVIVGGESGPQARPMKEEWVLSIQKQTERQGSAFFFKQWGTWGSDGIKRNKHQNGKLINGKVFQAMPMEIG